MFSYLDKKVLGRLGSWHRNDQVLTPQVQRHDRPVILVHGFIGSPLDMKPLAKALVCEGYRVILPVTPGQTWQTPIRKRKTYDLGFYTGWLSDIVADETGRTGLKPYLAGLSMGGALSTLIAARNMVDKLVLLAPFYKLPGVGDGIWNVSKRLSGLIPALPRVSKGNINCRQGYAAYTPGSCFISLNAFGHLGDIAFAARRAAGRIRIETRVFLSREDRVADAQMTCRLFAGMPNVRFHFEDRANHILLYDHGAQRIIRQIIAFFTS